VPLVVHLRRGQQVIVNGAVLENASDRTVSLSVKNEAAVLRSDDILSPSGAVTPASRAYYALQCAYLFREHADEHLAAFSELLDLYLEAAPSAVGIADGIRAAMAAGNLYAALKAARALIQHERKVLSHVEARLAEELHDAAACGESQEDGSLGADPGCQQNEGEQGCGRLRRHARCGTP
jgi:flagellar protein FlbT